jgi:hypothetical protein
MKLHLNTVSTLLLAALLAGPAGAAAPEPKPQDVRFAPGTSGVELKGTVKGYATNSYRLVAGAGQTLAVELKAANGAQNFNIVSPGSKEAMFMSDTAGPVAKVVLPTDGAYVIQTYLMRSAARRNEASSYTLKVSVTGTALPALSNAQDAKVPGTGFHATAPVRCKPPYVNDATTCEAGVIRRGRDGTATVVVRGPNDLLRQILFVKGQPVSSNTAQPMTSRRDGDTTVVDIDGQERYDIVDALLTGG